MPAGPQRGRDLGTVLREAAASLAGEGGEDGEIVFDRMSEDDLLRGLENMEPPTASDEEE